MKLLRRQASREAEHTMTNILIINGQQPIRSRKES